MGALLQLVDPLRGALPADTEVVLHDLRKLPNSIVGIAGNVTGRKCGDPATDLLLNDVAAGRSEPRRIYQTQLPDGRRLRSTTIIVSDQTGTPVAALCVNTDTTRWEVARDLLGSLVEGSQPARDSGDRPKPLGDHEAETFVHNVDELAALLIRNAVRQSGVPVELMKKDHKLQVVQELRARGMFTLRDAIGQVSEALEVSKFTIYNYLNEISEREAATSSKPVPRSRRRRTQ